MNERQDKKEQFESVEGKRPVVWIAAAMVVLCAVAAAWWTLAAPGDNATRVEARDGKVRIPVSQVDDGRAHFFTFANGQTDIDFFLVQSDDGVVRAAFDSCDVCYREKKGYRQEGRLMVCNNCDQSFPADRINVVKGGCNPAPLVRVVGSEHVLIAEADLKKGAWYFQGR